MVTSEQQHRMSMNYTCYNTMQNSTIQNNEIQNTKQLNTKHKTMKQKSLIEMANGHMKTQEHLLSADASSSTRNCTLAPDSCCIFLITSPPLPITMPTIALLTGICGGSGKRSEWVDEEIGKKMIGRKRWND